MALVVYNYLTRREEEFKPLHEGAVHIYVCGPTVYDHAHIGHAKAYISFDVVVRTFRYLGYRVRYVQNLTDVGHLLDTGEDRITKGARRERVEAGANDALVALSGPLAPHMQQALERLGYNVESAEDVEEGARLLEQGVYEVAVTTPAPSEPGKPETLAQRMLRLPIDARRRVFVILVGEEFRTSDGTQAWAAQADLVVHPADVGRCEHLVRSAMAERKRLYQPFVDAARKIEAD